MEYKIVTFRLLFLYPAIGIARNFLNKCIHFGIIPIKCVASFKLVMGIYTTSNMDASAGTVIVHGFFISFTVTANRVTGGTVRKAIPLYHLYAILTMGAMCLILRGETVTIVPQYCYGTNLQYLWSLFPYLNSGITAYPKASPLEDIKYELNLAGGIENCKANDSVPVMVCSFLKWKVQMKFPYQLEPGILLSIPGIKGKKSAGHYNYKVKIKK